MILALCDLRILPELKHHPPPSGRAFRPRCCVRFQFKPRLRPDLGNGVAVLPREVGAICASLPDFEALRDLLDVLPQGLVVPAVVRLDICLLYTSPSPRDS